MDWRELQANANVDPAAIRPIGDFVLLKPLSLDEQLAMEDRFIAPSPIHMTRDGRYREDRPRGNRYGRVIAQGDGDRMIIITCEDCGAVSTRVERVQDVKAWKCSGCGGRDIRSTGEFSRAPMNIGIGDLVVFVKVPVNEMIIAGQEYVWAHEEQHILAVIET